MAKNMKKEKFESLAQIRKKLDELDQEIIEKLAQRQFLVDQTSRFKHAVDDLQTPERIEQVIHHVRNLAQNQGLDADLTEKIYRDLLQHLIRRELKQIRP